MRKRKPGRLRDIAAAALAVFTRQGFRLTQMTDVAREAGISVGALYSYVDGKEALLELALAEALGENQENDEPFRATSRKSAGSALIAKLRKSVRWPVLTEALEQDRITPTTVIAVVDELFNVVAQHRHLIWLLDRCGAEIVELGGLYQSIVRGRYFADFTRFIAIATPGRDLDDEKVAARARALFEMVVWMGMHRHRDRQPPAVTDDTARQAVIDITLLAVRRRPNPTVRVHHELEVERSVRKRSKENGPLPPNTRPARQARYNRSTS
jgi:AcrR family transcriptional regulator